MPNKQQKKIILINNCIEIGLSDSDGPFSSIRISIPKKIIKSAVQRNKIKRQIKEIYRCSFQKNLYKNYSEIAGEICVAQPLKKLLFLLFLSIFL